MAESKKGSEGDGGMILDAHLAMNGEKGTHKEFKGNVATVYSNPLSNGGSVNGHHNGNAGTYMNVGKALGRAMVELLGGMTGSGEHSPIRSDDLTVVSSSSARMMGISNIALFA